MVLKCPDCVQDIPLRNNGWSWPHPTLYCVRCKQNFYLSRGKKLTTEKPAEWASKEDEERAKKIKEDKWEKVWEAPRKQYDNV